MGPVLTAYVIIMASIVCGAMASYFCFGAKIVVRLAFTWAMIITAAMFIGLFGMLIAIAVICVMLNDEGSETKALYFVALLPVLPIETYPIPFPGINYLWDLSYAGLLVLLFLFPSFFVFVNKLSQGGAKLRLSDFFFLWYFLLGLLLMFRLDSVTNTARAMFTMLVEYGVPYFVLSRFLSSPMSLNWLLSLMLIGGSFISVIAFAEAIVGWRVYGELLQSLNLVYDPLSLVPYVRDGFVRASGGAMLQPLAYAFFQSTCIVIIVFMWQQKQIKTLYAMAYATLFFLALFLTDSRGGLLSLIVGLALLYYMRLSPTLKLMATVAGGGCIVAIIAYFSSAGFGAVDELGTFDYRIQLIENSLDALKANLLFGSNDFLDNASLQKSLQGEGIIDIVNMYLQVALSMGLVGLFPFIMMFIMVLRDVWLKPEVQGIDHKNLLIAILVMHLVFIGTCSAVSFLPWYLFLFLAVGRAYADFSEKPTENFVYAPRLAV